MMLKKSQLNTVRMASYFTKKTTYLKLANLHGTMTCDVSQKINSRTKFSTVLAQN